MDVPIRPLNLDRVVPLWRLGRAFLYGWLAAVIIGKAGWDVITTPRVDEADALERLIYVKHDFGQLIDG